MPRQSAKKKQELKETDVIRHAYIEAGLPCQTCGAYPAVHPHEITAGAHRHRAVYEPSAQLYLCANCHEVLQGSPYQIQIACRVEEMIRAVNHCHGSLVVDREKVIVALGGTN